MLFAFSDMASSVVNIEKHDGSDGANVKNTSYGYQCSQPTLAIRFFVVSNPSFGPRVSKVNDQNQLDQNEAKATNHSKYHPDVTKRATWDEEGANHSPDNDKVFQPPKAIL